MKIVKEKSVERLITIIKNNITPFVVFTNDNFYGSYTTTGSTAFLKVDSKMIDICNVEISNIKEFISNIIFTNSESGLPINFCIE